MKHPPIQCSNKMLINRLCGVISLFLFFPKNISLKIIHMVSDIIFTYQRHPWLNWIEHRSSEPGVGGSNPSGCVLIW